MWIGFGGCCKFRRGIETEVGGVGGGAGVKVVTLFCRF